MPKVSVATKSQHKKVPATERGRQRQQQLLHVACEHFLKHGYAATSLDAIVTEAGGSKAAVYHHFGGKQALFAAVIEQLCAEFLAQLRAIDVSGVTLADGLRTILQELVNVVANARHVAFYRLVIAGSKRFPEAGQTWYEHGPMVWFDVFMRLFDIQERKGQIRADAPKAVVAGILFDAVLSFLTTQFVILGRPIDKRLAEPVIEALITMAQSRLAPSCC
ncbi:TetR family transcriptional regulator [Kerstersia gyiorum]|uniref:TetR family transcriptional regulator n=1 Tax=Kerstersia gyiorum TaxID=206506 RepID=A0A4Q7MMJ4_9BURK|nr:TetR/AcrR family transcriptional regulator [Kerstersia gyiorum]KAB0544521.1 TetR/AcrR family transcriptional regulator [Kerstersia gyiorum]RZS69665.1 TetR family transcriptional regulator [Kerstersia gyiorum]